MNDLPINKCKHGRFNWEPCEECALRDRLAKAEARADENERLGKQFEADARKHFDQSCQNLARADAAEKALAVEVSAHETTLRAQRETAATGVGFREQRDAATQQAEALAARVEELKAALEAVGAWMHDPNDPEQFDRIASEFRRATGYARPGKDTHPAEAMDHEKAWAAWETWRHARSAEVLAAVKAALSASDSGALSRLEARVLREAAGKCDESRGPSVTWAEVAMRLRALATEREKRTTTEAKP